jgi:hypothetical protein
MARLRDGKGRREPLDFRGFFGLEGLAERLADRITDLLVERKLLAPPAILGDADVPPPVPPDLRPVAADDVDAIVDLVFDACDWYPERQEDWRVKGWWSPPPKEGQQDQPQDDPLNSFVAEDLERVDGELAAGNAGAALQAYLLGENPPGRIDLERNPGVLLAGVAPSRAPLACWPASSPLVTAQQFAVNTALRELAEGAGLFAVNGPPGTGKTTMLKDVIAAVIGRRADVLAGFSNPAEAFAGKIGIDNYKYGAYRLQQRLEGFGIVVASANNGAVENITKELPALAKIADGFPIDYFPEVADTVAAGAKAKRLPEQRQHWGLATAVLGSLDKRSLFARRFWLAGMPPRRKPGEPERPPDPMRLRSLQELARVGELRALPWADARAAYLAARERVERCLEAAHAAAEALAALRAAERDHDEAVREREKVEEELEGFAFLLPLWRDVVASHDETLQCATHRLCCANARDEGLRALLEAEEALALLQAGMPGDAVALAESGQQQAEAVLATLRQEHDDHHRRRPGFWSQLFRTPYSRRWNMRDSEFEQQRREAIARREHAAAELASALAHRRKLSGARDKSAALAEQARRAAETARALGLRDQEDADTIAEEVRSLTEERARDAGMLQDLEESRRTAQARSETLQAGIRAARGRIDAARGVMARCGLDDEHVPHWELHSLDRAAMHLANPSHLPALFAARRALFVAALDLHKAFIAATWKTLAPTLAAFVNVLQGQLRPCQVKGGVQQLWEAFFLVVPVVSTTFASFPRLFAGMPRESIGWLLVDEAGQAAPQQAVGALWRARRALIVGDPLQLEPVVGLPDELVTPLRERCGAEQQWEPPAASAQTLADRANRHGVYLAQGTDDPVWLGAPLVVHRRCLDPMFGIANAIAYDNKMVYGTTADSAGDEFGSSRWIDMPAHDAEGHWIPSQARYAAHIVHEITGGNLRCKDGRLRVYVITPFRVVARKMYTLLHERYGDAMQGMVGTVHTFQGKEADHVIFLLGGNPDSPGVISRFAGAKPNLVNVAVTRAKRRLYVIGKRDYWTGPTDVRGIFTRLAEQLPVEQGEPPSTR